MSYGIGIDIGGTKILGVLTDDRGNVLKREKKDTGDTREGGRIVEGIVSMIEKLKNRDVQSIGIGCAGFVDHINGIVRESPNIKFLKDFPLKDVIEERVGIPVFVDNDVKAGAVAEMFIGGKGKNFIYITIGTGIGGCIVSNGKILRGINNMAGEIGHITIDEFGPLCGCGKRGCVEALASGTFIKKYFIHGVKMGVKTSVLKDVNDVSEIDVPLITKHAKLGDRLSLEVLGISARNIGLLISILINIFNPERVVIGGGLLKGLEPVFDEIVEVARLNSLKIPFENTKIEISSIKDGVSVGASIMGIKRREGLII